MPRRPTNTHGERMPNAHSSASKTVVIWRIVLGFAMVVGLVSYTYVRTQDRQTIESTATKKNSSTNESNPASANVDERLSSLNTASIAAELATANIQLDPGRDGWETEAVAEEAKKQLLQLCKRLEGNAFAGKLSAGISSEVDSGLLRPAELSEVFGNGLQVQDGRTVVRRTAAGEAKALVYHNYDGLRQAFDELAKPLADATDVHVHIKVIRVSVTAASAETTAYFEANGRTTTGSLQQRATWHCEWSRSSQGRLKLTSIRASDYEEVEVVGPWLVDCSVAVLGKNSSFREQLTFGHHHWLNRLSSSHGIHMFSRSGMSVGDVNGDRLDDIYVCQPGGLPNRLFVQQPDGTAIDCSHSAAVDWLDHTSSALIVDLDSDGDQDLVAATTAGLLVMENDSTGKFRLRSRLSAHETDLQSLSAVDFDHDGDLDLYVCIDFANQSPLEGSEFVYHDANDGAANVLFRNDINTNLEVDGKWTFTDVTKQVGLDSDNRRHSLACAWEDFDNDGDQDLYVANDYGKNCLYENEGGQFKNIALQANATDSASGMSVSWGDYNHDGWMDLYVANMFSSAGNRITRQEQFKPRADGKTRRLYSRFAKGNTLLQNDGQGRFHEVSESAGVEMGRWAWSSVFADLNNDSWDDLLVANGYISTEDTGDL